MNNRSPPGNDTERIRSVMIATALFTHCLRVLPATHCRQRQAASRRYRANKSSYDYHRTMHALPVGAARKRNDP